METQEKTIELVKKSYARCQENVDFFPIFYGDFLQQDNEIAGLFVDTDWYRQKILIKHAILSAILYAEEPEMLVVRKHMEEIARKHSRKELDVHPKWYPLWLDSMITAISLCDPKYTPELGDRWRKVLLPTISLMMSRYEA